MNFFIKKLLLKFKKKKVKLKEKVKLNQINFYLYQNLNFKKLIMKNKIKV